MYRNKVIAGFLAASMIIGLAACKRKNTDTPSGDGNPQTAVSSAPSGSGRDGITSIKGNVPLPEGEGVLFKYSDINTAWAFHWLQCIISYSGDVYIYEKYAAMQDRSSDTAELRYLTEYTVPSAHIAPDDLEKLYNACLKIAPDVETDMKVTGNDMGEYKFVYVDPEYHTEIPLIITGDETMISDDPALNEAAELAKEIMGKLPGNAATHKIFLDISVAPALADRRTVNVPYDGADLIGSSMLFEGYDSLIRFCEENSIDLENYLDDKTREHLKECPRLMVQFFDTGIYAGGVMFTKDPSDPSEVKLEFLPSLEEFEYNPEYEGKVNMAVWGFSKDDNVRYLNANGDPWQIM